MKNKMKMWLLVGLLTLSGVQAFSQMSVSYYASSLSKAGLAYNFSDRFWTELRVYSNTTIDDLTPELVFCYNVAKKEHHNIYLGLGGNVNFFTGFVMPVGLQVMPLTNFKRFSFHIEFQPTLDIEGDFILQSSAGLRYKFEKRK